jgi:hypothetical protein
VTFGFDPPQIGTDCGKKNHDVVFDVVHEISVDQLLEAMDKLLFPEGKGIYLCTHANITFHIVSVYWKYIYRNIRTNTGVFNNSTMKQNLFVWIINLQMCSNINVWFCNIKFNEVFMLLCAGKNRTTDTIMKHGLIDVYAVDEIHEGISFQKLHEPRYIPCNFSFMYECIVLISMFNHDSTGACDSGDGKQDAGRRVAITLKYIVSNEEFARFFRIGTFGSQRTKIIPVSMGGMETHCT